MKKTVLFSAIALTASMVMYSCGGGGGGSSAPNNLPPLNIQPITNQTEAITNSYTAISLSNLVATTDTFTKQNEGVTNNGFFLLNLTKNNFLKHVGRIKAQGKDEGEENCESGGKVSYEYSWTNPSCSSLEDYNCWINNTITFKETYYNCVEYGITLNGYSEGKITIDQNGNESGNLNYTNFTIKYKDEESRLKNTIVEYKYNNGKEEINLKTGTLEKIVSGTTKLLVSFKDLIHKYIYSSNQIHYTVDGYYYEHLCYKKWYALKTESPFVYNGGLFNQCASSGLLKVNDSFSIKATSSGGIDILDINGNTVKNYGTCQEYQNEALKNMCSL